MGNRRFPSVVCKSKKEGKREAADAALRELIAEGEYISSAAANAALTTANNNNNGKKNANGDLNGGKCGYDALLLDHIQSPCSDFGLYLIRDQPTTCVNCNDLNKRVKPRNKIGFTLLFMF